MPFPTAMGHGESEESSSMPDQGSCCLSFGEQIGFRYVAEAD